MDAPIRRSAGVARSVVIKSRLYYTANILGGPDTVTVGSGTGFTSDIATAAGHDLLYGVEIDSNSATAATSLAMPPRIQPAHSTSSKQPGVAE